jgi:hypothetical protein
MADMATDDGTKKYPPEGGEGARKKPGGSTTCARSSLRVFGLQLALGPNLDFKLDGAGNDPPLKPLRNSRNRFPKNCGQSRLCGRFKVIFQLIRRHIYVDYGTP